MNKTKKHLIHCLLHEYKNFRNETEVVNNLLKVFEACVVRIRKCQRWFLTFCAVYISLIDKSQTDPLSVIDLD